MTTLGIRYLTGRSVARNLARPREPEWPPHPGRVFMAVAATYFETRGDVYERQALEWLEQAGAPAISASRGEPRSFVETYVPVNDKLDRDSGLALRARQPRSFPSIRPEHDCVYLIWSSEVPQHLRDALERLCNRVTRIGHSSSLVQIWLADRPETLDTDWQPSDMSCEHPMRVAAPGTLAYLHQSFNQEAIEKYQQLSDAWVEVNSIDKSRLRKETTEGFPEGEPKPTKPQLTRWQGYAQFSPGKVEEIQSGPFDSNLIVLRKKEECPILGLEATLQLTSALRDAAMKAAGNEVPEWLSGHQPNGSPTLKPHVAFFPLPFVGVQHADGHVMGLAITIPRAFEAQREARALALRQVFGPLLFRKTGEEKTVRLWRNHVWR